VRPEIRRFSASDGYPLHYRYWPASQPTADVVALHGIQSHSGWYEYSSERLAWAGFRVHFLDRRGSGLNQKLRGHTPNARRLVDDVVEFVRLLQEEGSNRRPLVLLSVSWGGKLAAVLGARNDLPWDAVVLLYPGLVPKVDVPLRQKLVVAWHAFRGDLHRLVPVPLDDPRLFTGQPRWQEFIRRDPLALREVSVSFLLAHRRLSREALRAFPKIRRPVLLMLAGQDQIVDNRATRRLAARLPTNLVTVIEYPDARHTLEFEPNREQIFDELVDWLQQTCGAKRE